MAFGTNYDSPLTLHEPTLRLWGVMRDHFHDPESQARALQAIDEGADVNARNRFGVSLLSMALNFDGPSLAHSRILLLAGARMGSAARKKIRKSQAGDLLLAHQALIERQALESGVSPILTSGASPRL